MKKILAAFMIVSLLLAAGCAAPSIDAGSTSTTTNATTTVPTTNSTTTATTKPMMDPDVYSEQFNKQGVWFLRIDENIWWDIEVPIFSISYPDIKLSGYYTDGHAAVAQDLRDRVNDFLSKKDEWVANAAEWSVTDQGFIGHAASFTITSIVDDEARQIISVNYHISTFLGGPHGHYTYYGLTYDRETGKLLALKDIIDPTATDALYQKVCAGLPTDVEYLDDPYATILENYFTDLSNTDIWELKENGLHFNFNTYELAPYVYGNIGIVIPYSELVGILLPQYLPQ